MKDDLGVATTSEQIRNALVSGAELTVGEIYERCDSVPSTNVVASIMFAECQAGRAERLGERGAYRYRLTEWGIAAAKDPRKLRSRSVRRRPDGSRPPPPASPSAPVAAPAAPRQKAHIEPARRQIPEKPPVEETTAQSASATVSSDNALPVSLQWAGEVASGMMHRGWIEQCARELRRQSSAASTLKASRLSPSPQTSAPIEPPMRLAAAVLVFWPRNVALPAELSALVLEAIDTARAA